MPLKRSNAFILKSMKYGESDKIVTFYSKDFGKIAGVAKAAVKSRKRFGGLLEPLTEVSVTYMEKEGKELSRVDHCDLIASHVRVQEDIQVYYAFSYMAEVVDLFSTFNEGDERFYRLIRSVIQAVEKGVDLTLCIRYFETWTLKLQGILPGVRNCSSCGKETGKAGADFFASRGDLLCLSCAEKAAQGGTERKVKLGPEIIEFLSQALKKRVEDVGQQLFLRAESNPRLEEFLHTLLMDFSEKPFKSYRYFKECLRELRE